MALFNKSKLNPKEENVLKKMLHSDLVNWLVDDILYNPNNEWARTGSPGEFWGYRRVTVYPHWYLVEIPNAYKQGDENHCIAINFQKSGYSPLYSQDGISEARMCYLYATAIQMRLKAEMPDYKFEPVKNERDLDRLGADGDAMLLLGLMLGQGIMASFIYYVPIPKTSSLF